jgi:membrane associated rhomboid family serine protease
MIIPVGHEQSEVRRLPWITLAIMAICVLALLATDPSGEAADVQGPTAVEEAADYWRERPYLQAPPEVLTEVGYDVAPNQRKQYIGLLRTSAEPPDDPAEIEAEQAELDAILLGEGSSEAAAEPVESPYRTFGLRPDEPTARGFLTHMFMHAGWLHLLGNLFMLYLAGPALEDRWGRPLYGAFYLLAGLASGAFFLAMDSRNLPLVGASGAIAGVLGAFLVRYAKTQIRFLYVFFVGIRFLRGTFTAPAWAALPLWFGNELLAASLGVEDGVAYWAHVGGFVFGVGAGLGIRQLRLEDRFERAIDSKLTVRGNAAVAEALELREAGDLEGAYAKLEAEVQRDPKDSDAALAFWDAAASLGRTKAALPALGRTIRELAASDPPTAARCWLEVCEHAPGARLDPQTLLKVHATLAAQHMDEEAKRALRHAADPRNPALTPALALRVLEAARERDPQAAASAARVALDSPHMPDEKKAKLRAQLAVFESSAPPPEESAPEPAVRRSEPIDIGLPEPDAQTPRAQAPEEDARFEIGRVLDASQLGGDLESETEAEIVAEPEPEREPEADAEPELADDELGALIGMSRFQDVKLMEAVPAGLDAQGVVLALGGGKNGRVAFEKIQGVAVAAVGGLAPRPIVLIDLLMNWNALEEATLRVVRLRSDRFDPKTLSPGAAGPLEALRAFLAELLERSGAAALPDPDGARGAPVRRYADLESYQREVLSVG